jgi:glycosyltransferase involved in cell wall biosynthesis
MIVGVVLEDFSAHEGGGYTIQSDIFHWLLELCDESKHSFVLFCNRPDEARDLIKSDRMKAVAFPGTFTERVVSVAKRKGSAIQKRLPQQSRFEQIAAEAGVDFVWFVSAQAFQVDLPYLAIVWDLQHRLQPWFPEVSSNGVWDHRESFYSRFLRRAAYVIAGTEAGSQEIQNFYQIPAHRVRLLPHPTPTFALKNCEGPLLEGDNQFLVSSGLIDPYLLYPAQFWPHKNHANLLMALKILKDERQLNLSVAFVGSDKGNRNYIRDLAAELGLSSQVNLLGFVSEDKLVALYKNALALTYVSFFGPENLPPLEAFALQCPVIAANVPGAGEQLGDAALLVNPASPIEIADAIEKVYHSEATRNELIAQGKKRAMKWTGKEFTREVFAILDEFENIRRCWAH